MGGMAAFTSDKKHLQDILKEVADGRIQLPEFQRGWVWDDDHIRSLLASVSMAYPIGAMMLLQTGNDRIRFKARPVEGVELAAPMSPDRFILDGQQRLTSLYQALCLGRAVATCDSRGRRIKRWYYIWMEKSLDSTVDREEAIVGLPEDRIVRSFRNEVLNDFSTPEAEYANGLFPLTQAFAPAKWHREYNAYWSYDAERMQLFDRFGEEVLDCFGKYLVPYIELLKESPRESVCQVFEKVNTGGVALSVFELVTASFAAEEYDLREDWEGKRDAGGRKVEPGRADRLHERPVLGSVKATDFLQVIALLTTYAKRKQDGKTPVACRRADVLKLELNEYTESAQAATEGFVQAAKFLFQQKVFSARDLPYGTQLVPLAALLALLGDGAHNDAVRGKLARWFWCGVFGELYGSAVETRSGRDVLEVMKWLDGGAEPNTIQECNFAASRLNTLRTRLSAAYKGLYALLMRDGCLDFLSGEPIDVQAYFDDKVDVHHIFPRDHCRKAKIDPGLVESIVNKTPLSAKTNRIIGGNAPSVYLGKLQTDKKIAPERLDEIVASHVAHVTALRQDDFTAFFEARKEALLCRIEAATGREIARETPEETATAVAEFMAEDEEPQEAAG